MITALIIAVVIVAVALAALVVIAARLDPHGIAAVPLRRADDLLAGFLSPPPGDHHKFAAPDALPVHPLLRDAARIALTPARYERPEQEPRPGDPRMAVREVRAGATPPGAAPQSAPSDGAATLAQPDPPHGSPGLGQHPYRPVIMQFPGGEVGILGADGRWHIKPLAWQPGIRETGGMPALVRGSYEAHEAWRDAAVNIP